ncbi:MAG: AraC family transcriptional regulator [Salinimicrobium sp.]
MINILLIASIFGFVLSTLLFLKRSTNTKATFFLGSFYLLLSVYTLQTYIVDGGHLDKYTWFFLWPLIPYNLFFVPVYYYFKVIFQDQLKWKKRQLLLFVPFLLAVIDAGYIYLQPYEVYSGILTDAIVHPKNRLDAKYLLLNLNQHVLIRHLWQIGALLVLLPQLLKFIQLGKEDKLKRILNKWLVLFWALLMIFGIFAVFYSVQKMGSDLFYPVLQNSQITGIVTLILYLSFLVIGIVPVYFPSILHGYPQLQKRFSSTQKDEKVETEALKYGLAEQEVETKLALLNQKKLYLDQNFNLTRCAQEMEMPSHHISYFLKRKYGLSFSAYKNNLRMDHAKRLIAEGFLENNTIEALAGECGFANRTSFSKAFKNTLDMSPSQYALTLN